MTRTERRKNPDYRIAELEAEVERLRADSGLWRDEARELRSTIARLHRIEVAARLVADEYGVQHATRALAALRTALEEEA